MNDIIHTEVYRGFTIEILPDEDASNPRVDCDNVGTMICFHRNYGLGDEKHGYLKVNFNSWAGLANQLKKDFGPDPVILSLYLYDHSGISISAQPWIGRAQHAEWDSGQVGFIVCSLKKAKEEWGMKGQLTKGWDGLANFTHNEDGTRRTLMQAALMQAAETYLLGEVETYNDYLTGNVYGYRIIDPEDEDENIDSCWGFLGDYEKWCLPEARSVVDVQVEVKRRKQQERKKTEIRHRVPLEKRS